MREIKYKVWYRGEMYDKVNLYIEPDYTGVEIVKGRGGNIHTDTMKAKLLQFTGLFDRSGVPIFEGDMLSFRTLTSTGGSNKMIYEVRWRGKGFKPTRMSEHNQNEMEVIGNSYENPELINFIKDSK